MVGGGDYYLERKMEEEDVEAGKREEEGIISHLCWESDGNKAKKRLVTMLTLVSIWQNGLCHLAGAEWEVVTVMNLGFRKFPDVYRGSWSNSLLGSTTQSPEAGTLPHRRRNAEQMLGGRVME